jgi:hypothetical protein
MDTYTLILVVVGIIFGAFLMALARMGTGTTVVVFRDGGGNTGGGQGLSAGWVLFVILAVVAAIGLLLNAM